MRKSLNHDEDRWVQRTSGATCDERIVTTIAAFRRTHDSNFNSLQYIPTTVVCLVAILAMNPILAREEGGGRGGRGHAGGAAPAKGHAPHNGSAHPAAPHAGAAAGPHGHHPDGPAAQGAAKGGPAVHRGAEIHRGGPAMHGNGPGGHHPGFAEHHFHGMHHAELMHAPGHHWNSYHQAYIGNRPIHLAHAGYRPSFYNHHWYHSPWGGHAWGWGWGYAPGVSFALTNGGIGVGVGSGWGYPAYYGPYGRYGYWGRPLGWGFGGWGLGTSVYSSGYYSYYNPYYMPAAYPVVVYNYSNPIVVASQAPPGTPAAVVSAHVTPPPNQFSGSTTTTTIATAPSPAAAPNNPAFDAARDAFKRGDYRGALANVDSAITRAPSDAVQHEFRSLVLFALGDYRQSAAVAHSILAVGPGWDSTTMSSLYPDPFIYPEQLRRLEDYSRQHPQAAEAHFLLAYHSMIGNRREVAAQELQQVVTLMPNDRLAGELLAMVKGPPNQPQASVATAPIPDTSTPVTPADKTAPATDASADATLPNIDKNLLPGTWNASRDDGSQFRLTMTADNKFTWKYSGSNQKAEEFSGTYTIDGPVLVLERNEGGALAGTATFNGAKQMNFKMVGAPPQDKGLDFGS